MSENSGIAEMDSESKSRRLYRAWYVSCYRCDHTKDDVPLTEQRPLQIAKTTLRAGALPAV